MLVGKVTLTSLIDGITGATELIDKSEPKSGTEGTTGTEISDQLGAVELALAVKSNAAAYLTIMWSYSP